MIEGPFYRNKVIAYYLVRISPGATNCVIPMLIGYDIP